MVEARPPSVPQNKDGNPFCGKGEAAEDPALFPGDGFWDAAEDAADCHRLWSAIIEKDVLFASPFSIP